MLFARLAKEPFQFAPPVVAEMTIPQALLCFRETDTEKIKKQSRREASDAKIFKGKNTIRFDTIEDYNKWKAEQNAGIQAN